MRFAKVGEEVLSRHKELTGEELRLYLIIVFHAVTVSGNCLLSLADICRTYEMSYNPTSQKIASLRRKGWLDASKTLKPLVGTDDSNN